MSEPSPESTYQPKIVATPGTCGGDPRIDGTRIKIQNIVIWHEKMGMSFEDILEGYPTLRLADLHAAMAFYQDHRQEILDSLEAEREFVERLRRESPPHPKLARLREKADAEDNSVPLG